MEWFYEPNNETELIQVVIKRLHHSIHPKSRQPPYITEGLQMRVFGLITLKTRFNALVRPLNFGILSAKENLLNGLSADSP